jgi:hypothetical protein
VRMKSSAGVRSSTLMFTILHPSKTHPDDAQSRATVLRRNSIRVQWGGLYQGDRLETISSPHVLRTALALITDLLRLLRLTFRSRAQLAAENLFLVHLLDETERLV